MTSEPIDRFPPDERAGVVIPYLSAGDRPNGARIVETSGLVEALGCDLTFIREDFIRRATPSHLFPKGRLEAISSALAEAACTILIVDGALTPIQQRNLERDLGIKVIDRTGLILEIFGLRARTKEGRLQVELARLLYERSRLVRTWTHLERQRGGRGFLSGPGETQLEADRRMLETRLKRLRRDLDQVRRTRAVQRAGRRRSATPITALVGYTNAGKSTLFNALTHADAFARDMPFATLDTTIRRADLDGIGPVDLVDTVGFITDLPTHLVDAFSATLEEALDADLLIHVRDRSSPVDHEQKQDVLAVLAQLEARAGRSAPPIVEAWNKIDLLGEEERATLMAAAPAADPAAVCVAAATGEGLGALKALIGAQLRAAAQGFEVRLEPHDGAARAWLFERGAVVAETCQPSGASQVEVRLAADDARRFRAAFPDVSLRDRRKDAAA